MVNEFPAVSHTRVGTWGKPQYSRTTLWWITFVLGAFGFHHLYLRSPQTMILFFFANLVTFGYWYWYDLIQLSSAGELGTQGLNDYGMSSPFGPLGLAQGMFKPEEEETNPPPSSPSPSKVNQTGGSIQANPPSPWIWVLYFFTLPFTPLSNTIVGDGKNGLAKFANILLLPLFLLTIAYDYFITFVKPADLFLFGVKRFYPWTLFGMDTDGHSPYLTGQKNYVSCPPENNLQTLVKMALPFLRVAFPGLAKSLEQALNIATATKDKVVSSVQTGMKVTEQVGKLATEVPMAAAEAMGTAKEEIQKATAAAAAGPQLGGGQQQEPMTTLDKLSLGGLAALVGGGLLLSLSRVFPSHAVLSDSPPNPGTI